MLGSITTTRSKQSAVRARGRRPQSDASLGAFINNVEGKDSEKLIAKASGVAFLSRHMNQAHRGVLVVCDGDAVGTYM
jgi:hypothetical protein